MILCLHIFYKIIHSVNSFNKQSGKLSSIEKTTVSAYTARRDNEKEEEYWRKQFKQPL